MEPSAVIIGAGPVGLAIAIELARLDLAVIVVDRRPPPDEDPGLRPQLLVARDGDLANLAHLGIDTGDPELVSLLATRVERDLASGQIVRGDVVVPRGLARPSDLRTLASQPPLALVPIGRLQQALLAEARRAGAIVQYGCDVVKLRRHARDVSLVCAAEGPRSGAPSGNTIRAAIAIVATGAARHLVAESAAQSSAAQRLIAGLFDVSGDTARWVRSELPVEGFARPTRSTFLQTTSAGSALLVDSGEPAPSDEQLHRCFAAAARAHGLTGAPLVGKARAQPFPTSVTTLPRRYLAGDGRAPVIIAGDAAQTGHVFTGQTCFVNLALGLSLVELLVHARSAIVDQKVNAPSLVGALERYETRSAAGAAILANASARHLASHAAGDWALAGVARA